MQKNQPPSCIIAGEDLKRCKAKMPFSMEKINKRGPAQSQFSTLQWSRNKPEDRRFVMIWGLTVSTPKAVMAQAAVPVCWGNSTLQGVRATCRNQQFHLPGNQMTPRWDLCGEDTTEHLCCSVPRQSLCSQQQMPLSTANTTLIGSIKGVQGNPQRSLPRKLLF